MHDWIVGGASYENMYESSVQTAYRYEILNSNNDIENNYEAKVGLMYVSDYGYAADPSYWTEDLKSYNKTNYSNWLYMGLQDFTISRRSDSTEVLFNVHSQGNIATNGVDYVIYGGGIRPAFYLNSDVTYVSGSGSYSDPFRIA